MNKKAGIPYINKPNITDPTSSLVCFSSVLKILTIIKSTTTVQATVHPKVGTCFISISFPWLLKILFSLTVTPLKRFKTKAIMTIANIIPIVIEPISIPRTNIKFQKLSLFLKEMFSFKVTSVGLFESPTDFWTDSATLVKSCIKLACNFKFNVHRFIVPKLKIFSKAIIALKLAFLFVFSGNVAFANDALQTEIVTMQEYIKIVEKQKLIPAGLLGAIALVESGYKPYALNIAGRSLIAENKSEALYRVKKALAEGITNIDVGVMQINWRWHNENFDSLEKMLEPKANIDYAADLLLALRGKHGDWHTAIRRYHSANAVFHRKYSRKIVLAWLGG